MKILVCISYVPDTTTKIQFTGDGKSLQAAGVQFILNPYDEYALAKALELTKDGTDGSVTVIHVGKSETEAVIRKALAAGANDAIRIDAEPTDAYFVASQIASYAASRSFDLILAGNESIDYNGCQVPAMVAELLDLPSVLFAKSLNIENGVATLESEIEGGKEILKSPLPMVVSAIEGMAEARIPNMRGIMSARTKPLEILPPAESAALTQVTGHEIPAPRGQVKLIDAEQTQQLIELLHEEAKVI